MKKFTIALISALVALASCDTGLLIQTPGQPPLIAGIEVNGATDNLYALVGAAGQLGLTAAWDDATYTNTSEYVMQSVGGEGSFKFASPVALVLDGGFKIRQKGTWNNQIGIDGTGGEGGDFTFNNLKAGFDGKTYVLVITVLRGAGAKAFATATLEERSDVRAPKAVTGEVTTGDAPAAPRYALIRAIFNRDSNDLFFLAGNKDALFKGKNDGGVAVVDKDAPFLPQSQDFQALHSDTKEGLGKPFVVKTIAFYNNTTKTLKDADGDDVTVLDAVNFIYLQEGKTIRLQRPSNATGANVAITVPGTVTWRESPTAAQAYAIIIEGGVATFVDYATASLPKAAGFVLPNLINADATGIDYALTTGNSGNAARASFQVIINNFVGGEEYTIVGGVDGNGFFTAADGASSLAWQNNADGTSIRTSENTLTFPRLWYVPTTPPGDWGATPAGAEMAWKVVVRNSWGDFIGSGSGGGNVFLSGIGVNNTAVITIDASRF